MANDELEYLKSLVTALNSKIDALENKAKSAVSNATGTAKATFEPAKELRMILVGPPGAGASLNSPNFSSNPGSLETGARVISARRRTASSFYEVLS